MKETDNGYVETDPGYIEGWDGLLSPGGGGTGVIEGDNRIL